MERGKTRFRPTELYTAGTAQVLILALLVAAYLSGETFYLLPAIGVLLLLMIYPGIFRPLAVVWHYFSLGLSYVMNRVILGIVFFGLVSPVGIVRRWLGRDPMKRRRWKEGNQSVFENRNQRIASSDLEVPY